MLQYQNNDYRLNKSTIIIHNIMHGYIIITVNFIILLLKEFWNLIHFLNITKIVFIFLYALVSV